MYKKIEWLYMASGLYMRLRSLIVKAHSTTSGVLKMSQLIKTETKSPTMPKMQSKLFAAFDVEKFTKPDLRQGLEPCRHYRTQRNRHERSCR
jgi:hypothetical protein